MTHPRAEAVAIATAKLDAAMWDAVAAMCNDDAGLTQVEVVKIVNDSYGRLLDGNVECLLRLERHGHAEKPADEA